MADVATRTPPGYWSLYQLIVPMLPLLIGMFIITVAKLDPPKAYVDLLNGVVLGLLALSLIGNVVCSFYSGSPPTLTDGTKAGVWIVFVLVAAMAIACVCIELLSEVLSKGVYLSIQGIFAVISSLISFKART